MHVSLKELVQLYKHVLYLEQLYRCMDRFYRENSCILIHILPIAGQDMYMGTHILNQRNKGK